MFLGQAIYVLGPLQLTNGAFDTVVFQLCGQRPVAEIAELVADLLPDLSGSVNVYSLKLIESELTLRFASRCDAAAPQAR